MSLREIVSVSKADTDVKGESIKLKFSNPRKVNHLVTMEDYRDGQNVRKYVIEGYVNGNWMEIYKGQSIGRKKIDFFDAIETSVIRINFTDFTGKPSIRSISAYYVDDFIPPKQRSLSVWSSWKNVMNWSREDIKNNKNFAFCIGSRAYNSFIC